MKKVVSLVLSAALVAGMAISVSAFATGTQRAADATDSTWDYPWYKTTATAPSAYAGTGNEGPASYAADGNGATYWHSNWDTNHPENGSVDLSGDPDNRYIQLELDQVVELKGLRYLPRQGTAQGTQNGRATQYQVKVSTEENGTWTEVASGTWESNTDWKIAEFETPAQAKYVRLYGVHTENDNGSANMYMSCAELRVQTTQEQEENIFLNKTASASSQLSGQEANKANDGDGGTKWCSQDPDHYTTDFGTHWWQVDLGWDYNVNEVTLLFETSSNWQYHVAVSDDVNFTNYTIQTKDIATVTANKAVVTVNRTGRYVRVYLKNDDTNRWPCLWEVIGTGTSQDASQDLRALVNEADGKKAEWYARGWNEYMAAIETAKTLLEADTPDQVAMTQAIAAIETAKKGLVEREQYTAEDRFVFPNQGETATLEAEFGELHNVESSGEQYAIGVIQNDWASHGEFVNCFDPGDSIVFYYNAPVAGTYSVQAFYRSGSTSNKLAWSGDHIAEGSVEAGASAATETKTVTFDLTITEAGAGTLKFTAPDTKSPQLDKLEITLTKAAYSVTVNPATGGTATANPTTAAAGDMVTLTATPDTGYHFKEWQVEGNAVKITDNTFAMPEGNVTITPVFEAHSYGEPTFSWAEDGSSATATFTCSCGEEHEETAVITSEVKTEATCTVMGTTTYTATVTVDFGEGTYTSTKDVQDIPATGHTQETIPGKAATCTQDGLTDGVKCSVCGEILVEQEVIKATGHHYVDGVCTNCGAKDPNYVPPTENPDPDPSTPVDPEPSAPVTGGDVTVDNNTDNQITVGNADQVFEANTVITVESVTQGVIFDTVKEALKDVVSDMKHTAILDITATLDGKAVQPDGKVQMTFAIPEHLSADNLKLFYVSDDGKTTEEIAITVNKDARTVTANLEHFSTYVLANVVVDGDTGTVPPTGDASQLVLFTGLMLASAACVGLVVVSRKRRA